MSKMFADVQPAVRKETKKVAIGTFVCVVLMWAVFGIGHLAVPEQIPFDYTVLLAGFIGGMVAVLNFFLMGLTVQKIVSMEDDKQAAAKMKASYSQRMMLQLIWGVLAIAVPCFQFVAGILPLLIPGTAIKLVGAVKGKEGGERQGWRLISPVQRSFLRPRSMYRFWENYRSARH